MNDKLGKYAKEEGFCCLWAFLARVKSQYTATIYEDEGLEKICTLRALQYARRKFRKGQIRCEGCDDCQKEKILTARTNP